MYHNGAPEDAFGANQFDLLVRNGPFGIALAVCLEVAKVTYMALVITGGTVGFREGIDYSEGSCEPYCSPK